jgi:serine/threonine protein kinase
MATDTNTADNFYTLPVGTVLNSRFEITKILGEGGFGITYLGLDKKLDRQVAIKEFFPSKFAFRNSEDHITVSTFSGEKGQTYRRQLSKFLREAKRTAQFGKSNGIVDIIDYFEENNSAYMVMEFLDGNSLGALLKEKGKLSLEETLRILRPVIFSLRDMHNAKLIHRDIAPDNIMFTGSKAKLIDFGAAADLEEEQSNSSAIIVKACYVPEEQYDSARDRQGPWTDVYAICATIYKCITGETIPNAIDRLRGVVTLKPLPDSIKNAEIIMKGLESNPNDRLQSVDELIAAFYPDSDEPPPVKKRLPVGVIIGIIAVLAVAAAAIIIIPKLTAAPEQIPPVADTASVTEPLQTTAPSTETSAAATEVTYDGDFTYENYAAKYEHDIANPDYYSLFDINRTCIISPSVSFKVLYCAIGPLSDDESVVMFQTDINAAGKTIDLLDFVCRYETASSESGFSEIALEQSYDLKTSANIAFPYTVGDKEEVVFGYEVPSDTVLAELVFTGTDSELTDALTGINGKSIIMRTEPAKPEV